MPLPGEDLYGLHRTTLYELAAKGKIRSAHLKKPGRQRGIRLIWLPSLIEYLDKLADQTGADSNEAMKHEHEKR
jgi:hypothetical protein